ncbi:uncharacterized protein MELLADRAFT_58667 [Melampsora larici-populina 98AG31]|uniref:Uncharacterized protein n=1 Tax=Melampsora larici-populina (strain 98AG31 / pathotype 3-4-7) TaxID=747676 RepID=F4R4E4_MELLP|nr:uncharacterized protein MELLADRAFT_58667 [Melampsora larici-populina 98AG31]EGG13015.1 hypothetical protein MELLADRAFT_58667 [Melampsora larici-populina 98AG31]
MCSDSGTVIEESDLADHFSLQEKSHAQVTSSEPSSASIQDSALWSPSPLYPGLVTSPSLKFHSHLQPYPSGISASPSTVMNRQMVEEANFLASFIPQSSHGTSFRDPFDSPQLKAQDNPEGQNWEAILRDRESIPTPLKEVLSTRYDPYDPPYGVAQSPGSSHGDFQDMEARRLETIILSTVSDSQALQQGNATDHGDLKWEDAIRKKHRVNFSKYPTSLKDSESEREASSPTYQMSRNQLHPPFFGPAPRRTMFDRRGNFKLGDSKIRDLLRIFQGLGSIIGFSILTITSIAVHPDPAPPQLKSLQVYLYFLISILCLSLSVWRLSKRLCGTPRDSSARGRADEDDGWSWGRRERANYNRRRRIESGLRDSYGYRSTPQAISVNFIVDGRVFAGASPNITESPNTYGQSLLSLDRRMDRPGIADQSKSRWGDWHETLMVDNQFHLSNMSPQKRHMFGLQWYEKARKLKQDSCLDVLFALIWFGWAIWTIAFKDKCMIGSFEGWCHAYNTSIAIAVIVALSFLANDSFSKHWLGRSHQFATADQVECNPKFVLLIADDTFIIKQCLLKASSGAYVVETDVVTPLSFGGVVAGWSKTYLSVQDWLDSGQNYQCVGY